MNALFCNIVFGRFEIFWTQSICHNAVQTVFNIKYLISIYLWWGIQIQIKHLINLFSLKATPIQSPSTSNTPFHSLIVVNIQYLRNRSIANKCVVTQKHLDLHKLCDSNTIGYWLAWNVSIEIVQVYSNNGFAK